MSHYLLTLLLGPLLLLQGRTVRINTPTLPEPPGDRQGVKGKGPKLSILIIGDSAAAGVGANHQDEALLGQLIAQLSSNYCVKWKLTAVTGATTQSINQALASQEREIYDVVVTSLGVNDVTGNISPQRWQKQQAIFRKAIVQKYSPSLVIVSGLPPMGAFPALPNPLRWYLGRRAKLFNRILRQELSNTENIKLIIKEGIPDSKGMASDGFHPGPPFYREWARSISGIIKESQVP